MRLTSFTDYGLRMLMRMASAPGRGFSTAEFSTEFDVSRHHLAKIIQKLASHGIVATRRGAGGGATLAQPAEAVSVGQVVRVLEDRQALVECFAPGGGGCTLDGRCKLKSRLRAAEAAFLAELDRTTLADIALSPLTDIEGAA
ncbi:RrF2 family transcriptional regulator [Thalassorhabdomicrobium marinisediminis]|uniref:Rrf2 family transcriptional regulator n=1 Tax=Thalassorhabdomicrobium marinisediminis TaxID=2170577 RepID=A0A2T7FV49_9RHOB|nr:Rrf2 family transcriptional regulator [Thalassorhabdomicrobium marinisediminis]PVA06044.1 Rrf2 family transcriptional regulator [Thalassorhabdomicrobium marinisediminis]